ncbi:MAG: hypothetical protein FWB71_00755 [Defluviitaleaceae bacterium]|nr:hypothetical protein [Defluviitaleaceae bacterium]
MANILISQQAFFDIRYLILCLDDDNLSIHSRKVLDRLEKELDEKYEKMRKRMEYSEALKQ